MKPNSKRLIILYLTSWLPVIGAAICALLILKQMKLDKDYIETLQKRTVTLEIQVRQLKKQLQ